MQWHLAWFTEQKLLAAYYKSMPVCLWSNLTHTTPNENVVMEIGFCDREEQGKLDVVPVWL